MKKFNLSFFYLLAISTAALADRGSDSPCAQFAANRAIEFVRGYTPTDKVEGTIRASILQETREGLPSGKYDIRVSVDYVKGEKKFVYTGEGHALKVAVNTAHVPDQNNPSTYHCEQIGFIETIGPLEQIHFEVK